MGEATGQNTFALVLTNSSRSACYLFGYPGISLVGASGRVLGFQYERSGDQMISSRPPSRVAVAPGGRAAVSINKYRCDIRSLEEAVTLRLIPPDEQSSLTLNIARAGSSFAYCGPGDPGSVVHVSAIAASEAGTLAH